MNVKKFIFPSLAVCTVLALTLRLFTRATSAQRVPDGESYDEIDAYLEQQMRRLNIPGMALVIVEGDQIVHLRGFGQARPGGEAPSPQTPFVIGSTTKSFTALAVMQLAEAGQIDLDAPVQGYLPWFRVANPEASAQITVRHLLNQTSGLPLLPAWHLLADLDNSPGAAERQARGLSTLTLTRPVGSAFEYSNLNYNLLGLVVEAASGEPYADYIQHHIFTPLDMNHSYTSQAAAQQNGLAMGHRYWFGFPIAARDLPLPSGSLPSGQLISSAEDMGHYLIAHLNEGRYGDVQILSPEGIAELHRPAVEASMMGVPAGQYGMGWFVEEHGQTTITWHSGMVPDFFTYMAILPEQQKGMILFFNVYHFMISPALTEVGAGAAALLAGDQPAPAWTGAIPWALRGLLLIPILQVVGVVGTLRRLRRWQEEPESRPDGARKWGRHILLPLIPNLGWAGLALYLLASGIFGFLLLFMPDLTRLALVSGGFSLVWSVLRTGLILRTLGSRSSPQSLTRRATES
jgi:CubicO group peptidase (beta-lactamase class C family)